MIAVLPFVASAQTWNGLVPCDGPNGSGTTCNFDQLLKLINNLIAWVIIMAIPIMTALVAYAGYLYVSDQGSESNVKRAHDILIDAIYGFVIILAAYAFVKFLVAELTSGTIKSSITTLFIK